MRKQTIEFLQKADVIGLYKSGKTIKDISIELKVSPQTVGNYLRLNNIEIKRRNISLDINTVIDLYKNQGKTLKEISSILNIGTATLARWLKQADVQVIRKDRINNINYNIFDSIDTEEKAYWLGFLYADGGIDSTRPKVAINLSIKDESHLQKFMDFLGYTYKMRYQSLPTGDLCRMSFDNKHIVEVLNSYGCTPRKSLIIKFPSESVFKDPSLIRHFIRGYFDGDGCITYSNADHSAIEISIVGTKDFLDKCAKYFNNGYQHIRLHHPENGNTVTYILIATDRKAWNCVKYLYENSTIYLERKFNRYLEFRPLYEKSYIEAGKIGENCDVNTEINE